MNKKTIYGIFLLFITATVWGVAFVAQSVGMDYMNAFAFNCLRNIIGVMVLLPVLFYRRSKTRTQYRHNLEFNNNNANHLKNNIAVNTNHKKNKRPFTNTNNKQKKDLLFGGFVCGTALCIASNFQQLGIQYSTVGKSAFITTLYIVFVPIFGLFLKKKVSVQTWIGVILAMIGLYLLCMKDEAFVLGIEDIYLLLSAVFFTFQIMFVDYYVTKTDGVALSMMQFLVTAILSGICMIFTEIPSISDIIASA
ncbi:MAG: DMT family transporter, partial [Lachnospiraceae bacterium]|nr:DMT family transporter [Lachnospiraceae bacterium]